MTDRDQDRHPSHVEHVVDANLVATGLAPSNAMAMVDLAMAQSIAQVMHAAVHRQQQAGIVTSAAVAAACTRIVATARTSQSGAMHDSAPPPLSIVAPLTPAETIAAATTAAEAAISVLRAQAALAGDDAAQAQASLAAARDMMAQATADYVAVCEVATNTLKNFPSA